MDDVVQFPISTFHEIFEREGVDERIYTKIRDILKEPKQYNVAEPRSHPSPLKPKKKFHVLSTDFSEEAENKKVLKSLLNKLTALNKSTISAKLRDAIFDEQIFFDLCIHFIQQDRKIVSTYVDIMRELVGMDRLDKMVVDNFERNKNDCFWIIPSVFQDIDVYSNECDYDDYCKFSKWKTSVLCLVDFWRLYNDKLICCELADILLHALEKNIEGKRQDVDVLLELLDILYDFIDLDRFKNIDYKNKNKSTHFKIQAILERDHKK